jgi:DNA-binding response OmpR family regulator
MKSEGNSKPRILMVDDEPNILVAMEFLFEQQGYQVMKAFDGQSALDKLHTFKPHIIVLDVMMPGLSGYNVAARVRSMKEFENVHIIFLTARGTQKDRLEGYGNGGEVYLTKPFDNDELVRVVAEVVEYGLS